MNGGETVGGRADLARSTALVGLFALASCGPGPPAPASLEAGEACRSCRMAIADPRVAAQLVAPGEEPRFFDDIGCLRDFMAAAHPLPRGSVAYVADHRTKVWVRAFGAVYTRVGGFETPMGSHLIAHTDAQSRDADPLARGGTAVAAGEIFGLSGAP